MESRTQGSRPRPRTQKKSEAKDSLSEDRHSRGQGQKCSRPRPRTKDTSASALQKKKRSSQKVFKRSPQKNVFQKIFQALHKILTIQKLVLSSSRGQANFRGLEASRPRTSKCVLEDSTSGIRDWQKQVSFDVVSLFTTIPLDLAKQIVFDRLSGDPHLEDLTTLSVPELIEALDICFSSTSFTFQQTIYQQIFGTPMGLSLSPLIANMVMEKPEQRANAAFTPLLVFGFAMLMTCM